MAKWARSGVLDNGLNDIKNNATRMILVSAYAAGDSYATVIANRLAEATMVNADFVLSSSGNNRLLTSAAGKSAVATATVGGTPDLHIVFTDGVSSVIYATDETTNQPITTGNTINFPQIVYTNNQPV